MKRNEIKHNIRVKILKTVLEKGWIESAGLWWVSFNFKRTKEFKFMLRSQKGYAASIMVIIPYRWKSGYCAAVDRLAFWAAAMDRHGGKNILHDKTIIHKVNVLKSVFTDEGIKEKLSEVTGLSIKELTFMERMEN